MNTQPELSIIIPCFNCASTLEEAVGSCFTQNVHSFEIVMVDDCSTDGTRSVMERLAGIHKEIRIFFHDKNKGGGATRNTAVGYAEGDIIFCLDSDDILVPDTLRKMISCMKDNGCDGVGVNVSKKFNGNNVDDIVRVDTFGYKGKVIPFESLLQQNGVLSPLYSTFMLTKRAFKIAGGYPEDHGFDTQTFAWKFLSNGLIAFTCPDAVYLHRLPLNKSYYTREYESGKINFNWFNVFQEFLYLFNDETKKMILEFDLGSERSLSDAIFKSAQPVWRNDYKSFIVENSKEYYIKRVKAGISGMLDDYYFGYYFYAKENYQTALQYLIKAKEAGLQDKLTLDKIDLLIFSTQGKLGDTIAENKARTIKENMTRVKYGAGLNIVTRIAKKLKKMALQGLLNVRKIFIYTKQHILVRITKKHGLSLIYNWLLLAGRKMIQENFTQDESEAYKEPISLVIPTVSKDSSLLVEVIRSIQQNINHPIAAIYIVSFGDEIKDFCKNNDLLFIDERSILGYGKEMIEYKPNGIDRSGWLFQQLLKLSGETFVKTEYYLVVDSDTVLINKHSFIEGYKTLFRENEEWNDAYFTSFEKIFGYEAPTRVSFTSHMMMFNCNYLKEMKQELEKQNGMSWDKAYTSTARPDENSCISDYDTYANWVLHNHPGNFSSLPFYNKSLPRTLFNDVETLHEQYGKHYASLSFHSYIN